MTRRTDKPQDVVVELVMPESSERDLRTLASILHADKDDPLASLTQDAFCTLMWLIRQQAGGRSLLSVSSATRAYVATLKDAPDDIAKEVVSYIPAGAEDQIRAWLTRMGEDRP